MFHLGFSGRKACGTHIGAQFSVALFAISFPLSLSGQLVRGQMVDLVSGAPVDSGVVVLLDGSRTEVARSFTNVEGFFQLQVPGAGEYSLRADRDGYSVSEFAPFQISADGNLGFRLLVPSQGMGPPDGMAAGDDEDRLKRICPGEEVSGLPMVVGVVRHGLTLEPIADAAILVTWSTVPAQFVGLVRSGFDDSQDAVVTGTTGFFSICGLPRGSRIDFHAESDSLSSQLVSVSFDSSGVYVGRRFVTMESRLFRQDLQVFPQGHQTASIAGTVADTSGNGISNAQIRIAGTQYSTQSNLLGHFDLTGLPSGSMQIAAEAVGYLPARILTELKTGEALELPFNGLRMRPAPTRLAPITVSAEAPTTRRDLTEFDRRRARGSGSFVTRSEFMEDGEPLKTTDVLRKMRGISVRPGPSARQPWIITSGRDARSTAPRSEGVCYPLVFVDEMHVGTTGNYTVDNLISVDQIEAIEFYPSAAGIPVAFNRPGSGCGVLAFWTR